MRIQLTLLIISLSLLSINSSYGQKLKDKRVSIKYVQLPSDPLPAEYNTYSVEVVGGSMATSGTNRSTYEKKIVLDGHKRMEENENGHLRIRVNTGTAYIDYGEYKKNTKTSKDKEGKETKTTTYFYEFDARSNASYTVYSPDGKTLATNTQAYSETLTSRKYSSYAELKKQKSSQRSSLRKKFASDVSNGIVKITQKEVAKYFDFDNATMSKELYHIKKHDDEKKFEKHVDDAQKMFEEAEATTSVEELKTKFGPMMEFWKKYADKDPKGDKKLNRIHLATNYNLALLNIYLDDFDTAQKHLDAIIKIDDKHAKSNTLVKFIETSKALMELNGIQTLHHKRDFADALPPSKISELDAIKEELEDENESITGSLKMGDKEISGSFMQEKDSGEMSFGEGGNTKFMVEEDAEIKEIDLSSADVTGFKMGEREFTKIRFSPCAKGKEEAQLHLLEKVYTSETITLFKYYPKANAMGDQKTEFAFQKTGEEFPVSLMDTKFLIWKKGIAAYFEDCADLAEMCTAGDIAMEKDSLIKAGRIYSELCK